MCLSHWQCPVPGHQNRCRKPAGGLPGIHLTTFLQLLQLRILWGKAALRCPDIPHNQYFFAAIFFERKRQTAKGLNGYGIEFVHACNVKTNRLNKRNNVDLYQHALKSTMAQTRCS